MSKRWTHPPLIAAAALLFVLAGCASTPVPTAQLAMAEAAVAQAGSTAGTSAPTEMRVAVDKLAAARSATAAGDQDRARRLAEQATLDAQVAALHAQAVRALAAERESEEAARVLREEINRKTVR